MPLDLGGAARYRAFMLRCWEVRGERPGQPATWRFSLECVETKEKRYLPDLEGLVAFLRDELANAGDDRKAHSRLSTEVWNPPSV
jgi:hypothetical protein